MTQGLRAGDSVKLVEFSNAILRNMKNYNFYYLRFFVITQHLLLGEKLTVTTSEYGSRKNPQEILEYYGSSEFIGGRHSKECLGGVQLSS